MRVLASLILLVGCAVCSAQDRPVPASEAAQRFTLPDGFKATLFAGEPDVVQPIAFTFDDRGRLWVVDFINSRALRFDTATFDAYLPLAARPLHAHGDDRHDRDRDGEDHHHHQQCDSHVERTFRTGDSSMQHDGRHSRHRRPGKPHGRVNCS